MDRNLKENKRFFDGCAASYDKGIVPYWMKMFYRSALEDIGMEGCVLDVSCGTGNLLEELSRRGHQQLVGIDYSSEMVEIARRKLGDRAMIQKADVHHLPFDDESFRYVVTTEAFHNYYNQPQALQELVRVTERGGRVIVCDLNFFLEPIQWVFQKIEPGCAKINSRREMRGLFEQAGLQSIQQQRSFLFAVKTV